MYWVYTFQQWQLIGGSECEGIGLIGSHVLKKCSLTIVSHKVSLTWALSYTHTYILLLYLHSYWKLPAISKITYQFPIFLKLQVTHSLSQHYGRLQLLLIISCNWWSLCYLKATLGPWCLFIQNKNSSTSPDPWTVERDFQVQHFSKVWK